MNIIIIEDEVKTAKALARLITEIKPGTKILASIQSIETAIHYLQQNPKPDLIFMDIQLADGICFEIFKQVKVISPVIFCTAFDDYALEAFKTNGIDYVLKPFTKASITGAFEKVQELQNFFQSASKDILSIEALLSRSHDNGGKKRFLVFKNNKYITVATENIAYFYIRNETPTIVTFDQLEYPVSQSLDEIHSLLPAKQFFRLNRQYLISFSAIKEVEPYFARKLFVNLAVPTPEKLLIGKDKTTIFLTWLENR
jgi:two-component system response regulator LytT